MGLVALLADPPVTKCTIMAELASGDESECLALLRARQIFWHT